MLLNSRHLPVLLLVAMNVVLKGLFIGTNALAGDEPFSVYHALMDLPDLVNTLSQGNNPPLYEIILHYGIKIGGVSPVSVRWPSLLFSSLTILILYKIGLRFFNVQTAFLSGVLYLFSNYHLSFAHEARVYALLGMLTVWSVYLYLQMLQSLSRPELRHEKGSLGYYLPFVVLAIVNALLIYAHYFGVFILGVQGLFLLGYPSIWKPHIKGFLLYLMALIVMYIPNLYVFFQRVSVASDGTWLLPPDGLEKAYFMWCDFSNEPVVAVVFLAVCLWAAARYLRSRKRIRVHMATAFVIFWFCTLFWGMFLVSFWFPMFLDRYLMPAAIAFPLLMGISIDTISQKLTIGPWLIGVMVVLMAATFKPNFSNDREAQACVEQIKQLKSAQTMVYISPDWFDLNFLYYYDLEAFKQRCGGRQPKDYLRSENVYLVKTHLQLDTIQMQQMNTILYLDAETGFHYSKNQIKQTLDQLFILKNQYHFPESFTLNEYEVHQK
jgi:mannosyltransferase